jgi:tRNA (cytidine32/guanosine34-2'-O)-methyltransferase
MADSFQRFFFAICCLTTHITCCKSEPRSRAPPDPFYRNAKKYGYRARSAYKLLEIDEEFKIFENVTNVVDLCAAPGSWSQVIRSRLSIPRAETSIGPQIVAVDLQCMRPIPGVFQLSADITRQETIDAIRKAFNFSSETRSGGCCQLVVCDGAPDLSGLLEFDAHLTHVLAIAALRASASLLAPGGTFVLKLFVAGPQPPAPLYPCAGADADGATVCARPFCGASSLLYAQLRSLFARVTLCKPRSSRATSREHFAVCRGFLPLSSTAPCRPVPGPAGSEVPSQPNEAVVLLSAAEGPAAPGLRQ